MGEVPPFVGVAVKVTCDPMHTGFTDAEILTEAGAGADTSSNAGAEKSVLQELDMEQRYW